MVYHILDTRGIIHFELNICINIEQYIILILDIINMIIY